MNFSSGNDPGENDSRRAPARIHPVLLAVLLVLLLWPLAFVAMSVVLCGLAMHGLSTSGPYREVVEDPAAEFTEYTGIEWPASAAIVSVGDDHGGFNGDGEFHLVFDADRQTLEKWLRDSPPWGQAEWRRGPVPNDIGGHCRFGSDSWAPADDADRSPAAARSEVLGSSEIRYVAEERCCESLRWHNGSLLIIDLANARVWLSVWDF